MADRQKNGDTTGYIYSVETFGTVDGPGVRYVLFLQGCPLRCLYCHNPDSVQTGVGRAAGVEDTVNEILRYRPYIRSGGVTFSGGEPLMQAEFVYSVICLLQKEGIHTAIDTAGCMPLRGAVTRAIDKADMLLLDIKAWDSHVAKKLTGRSSENAIATLDYCEKIRKPVWIRHVLLRGYTLDDNNLEHIARKISQYKCVERVELLPFHKLGEPKWQEAGRAYTLGDIDATTKEETEHAKAIFQGMGLRVQ